MAELGLHAYHYSVKLGQIDPPFFALIAAAMRKADTDNLDLLRDAFPGIYHEFARRYNAPLGVLPEDGPVNTEILTEQLSQMELRR